MSTTEPAPQEAPQPADVPPNAPAQDASLLPALTRPASAAAAVLSIPLAVSVGDGFKFGCGFLLAAGLTVAWLLVVGAAIFVVTSVSGVSLPVLGGR